MAKKLTNVLGVDVGSRWIKVCEVKSQGRSPVITALAVIECPEGSVDHTGIFNSDAVGAAIKSAAQQAGASASQAVMSVAGQASVLVRTLEVPKMNPTELREHMNWEIGRNIPFAESNVMSGYEPLGGDDPNSQNMDVVLAMAPESAISTVVACLKRAGKSAFAADVEPLAIARSLQISYGDLISNRSVCFVEIGAKTTAINIYRGAKLLMPRQIPIGGEMFTKAIADVLSIPMNDAERMKESDFQIPEDAAYAGTPGADPFGAEAAFQSYNPFSDEPPPVAPTVAPPDPSSPYLPPMPGIGPQEPTQSSVNFSSPDLSPDPSSSATGQIPVQAPSSEITIPPTPVSEATSSAAVPTNDRIYQAIASVLDEFGSEIRRSIDYFSGRGGVVEQIYLAGGGGKLNGLHQYLARALNVPCDLYDPFRNLSVQAKRVTPAFLDETRSSFTVAVGNALHIFFD